MSILSSQLFSAIKSYNTFIPENNIASETYTENDNGMYVVPSFDVPGRPSDITGYVLTAVNSDGKTEWKASAGGDLSLGELTDVNLSGLQNGNIIYYDLTTETWIPGSMTGITAGEGVSLFGTILNVNVDNSSIEINGSNELTIKNGGVSNAMLANSTIGLTEGGGIDLSDTTVSLGGSVSIAVDSTVIRTTENQTKTGDLDVVGTLQGSIITDGTLSINNGDISDILAISFLETGGGSDQINISAPAAVSGGGYSLKLPQAQGSASTFLKNDGSGNLTWSDGGLPGGTLNSIQYNNPSGTFAGSSNFTYDGTNVVLSGGSMTATSFNSTSDSNLKDNIQLLENCLGKVNRIKSYQYTWRPEISNDTSVQYGVIAQQLEEVGLGNVVINHENGIKSVNYNELVSLLLGAVNDLATKITILESRLT